MKMLFSRAHLAMLCVILVAVQVAWVFAYASDVTVKQGKLSAADYKFAQQAASGGITQIYLGKLAMEKSTNPKVQRFGLVMVAVRAKLGHDLAVIAARKGVTLPSEPTKVEQKEIAFLGNLSGPVFDRSYLKLMVREHEQDASQFQKATKSLSDPDLKAFATKTLSVIQENLKLAQDLEASADRKANARLASQEPWASGHQG